jgi:hypothetical protein
MREVVVLYETGDHREGESGTAAIPAIVFIEWLQFQEFIFLYFLPLPLLLSCHLFLVVVVVVVLVVVVWPWYGRIKLCLSP